MPALCACNILHDTVKMADEEALQAAIEAAAAAVSHQGDEVRSLKAELKDGKIEKVRS